MRDVPGSGRSRDRVPIDVTTFLSQFPDGVRALALRLRARLLKLIPDVEEKVYPGWRIISFRVGEGLKNQVCYIDPKRDRLHLGFEDGIALPDPDGLLEGKAARARHVKIRTRRDVDSPAIPRLVTAALHALRLRV
jgi:hypothetical protein